MKFIGDICEVKGLAAGETAGPVPDMGYELRTINGRFETSTVEISVRCGNRILARTTVGDLSERRTSVPDERRRLESPQDLKSPRSDAASICGCRTAFLTVGSCSVKPE